MLFHCNNCCTNASQCYLLRILLVLNNIVEGCLLIWLIRWIQHLRIQSQGTRKEVWTVKTLALLRRRQYHASSYYGLSRVDRPKYRMTCSPDKCCIGYLQAVTIKNLCYRKTVLWNKSGQYWSSHSIDVRFKFRPMARDFFSSLKRPDRPWGPTRQRDPFSGVKRPESTTNLHLAKK